MFVQSGLQILFAGQADEFFYYFATLENDDGRDSADTKLDGGIAVIVGIDFADKGLARVGVGDFLDSRAQHPAGTAPFRPEIQQYGLSA